jgi:hypothetical protein
MALESIQKVLDEVMAGRRIGENLWMAASREAKEAKAIVAAPACKGQEVVMVDVGGGGPGVKLNDAVQALGDLYVLFETLVAEMRAAGHLNAIDSDAADRVLAVRSLLKRLNFEPLRSQKPARLTYRVGSK